jgi:hypothetical protein
MFRSGGGGAPHEMGGCRTRLSGSPTVVMSEIVSKPPSTAACNANEVRVVQLLCVRWAHDVSNMLSANMVSSSVNLLAAMDTTKLASSACFQRKKRPRFHAARWNFSGTQGVGFEAISGARSTSERWTSALCPSELSELSAWELRLPLEV